MSLGLRIVLSVLCAVGLILVGIKFILPLVVQYMEGVGVAIPVPIRFAKTYPRLTIYLFVIGGPLLFIFLLAAGVWLVVRMRR